MPQNMHNTSVIQIAVIYFRLSVLQFSPFIYSFIHSFIYLFICLFVCLFVCVFVCLCVCLFVCLFVCLHTVDSGTNQIICICCQVIVRLGMK